MQFFLRLEDIGKSRAEATLPRLAELNAYVPVQNLGGKAGEEIAVAHLKGFHVSCVINRVVIRYLTIVGCCLDGCAPEETVGNR